VPEPARGEGATLTSERGPRPRHDSTVPWYREIVAARQLLDAGIAFLEPRRDELNAINVFPVADGDTGDNAFLTMAAARTELARCEQALGAGEQSKPLAIAFAVSRAALLGARGNCGVILSQIARGLAESLACEWEHALDLRVLADAAAAASEAAYLSVREPVEGTILTVTRSVATAIDAEAEMVGSALPPSNVRAAALSALEAALAAGVSEMHAGVMMIPELREANVVDAGALALVLLLEGMVAALRGDESQPRVDGELA